MSHTPGPWWYNERTESIGTPAGWLCSLSRRTRKSDVPFGKQLDDANLIAAAPDLVAACEADAVFWRHYIRCPKCAGTTFCPDAMMMAATASSLRAIAIAKVRGKHE